MGKRIVEITQTALGDMEGIYDYIADVLLAPENAMGQYNRIADAILTLESNPERCPVFEAEPERSWRMRRMVIDNYLVCYIADPEKSVSRLLKYAELLRVKKPVNDLIGVWL